MKRKVLIGFILSVLVGIYTLPVFAQDWIYTTRPGDTLWDISETYLKSVNYWQRLKEYNGVNIPKQLSPGIRIRIPVAWLKHQPQGVEVLFLRGNIIVIDQAGKQRALQVGEQLQIGDTIKSSENSNATLRFADGSTLILLSQSELILDSLSAYKDTGMVDTQMRLQRGRVETRVIPLQKNDSRYEIITPAAVASVRGTFYRVSVDSAEKLMRTEVLQGSVAVANEKAEEEVESGYGTVAVQDQRPAKPRKLLALPDIQAIPDRLNQLPTVVSWANLAGAVAYRVQVLSESKNEELIFDRQVSESEITLDDLVVGAYTIRVRGIDDIGLEGQNAIKTFTVDTTLDKALPPPVMDDEQVLASKLTLSWRPVVHATNYHIQVSTDEGFSNLIVDEIVASTTYDLTVDEKIDRYYYRVKSISARHEPGVFSRSTKINVN